MVDIIIPCYNSSDTLPRALASIAAQTAAKKCIVTLVDDCSTENLIPIINHFKPFLKIQYIKNKENMKYPGLVRQVGLRNTHCPYIMFLDADDILSPRAVEIAQTEMDKSGADMLLGTFLNQTEDGQWRILGETDTTWLHGNVYRRTFLEKNTIEFPSGYNEDGGFNTQCYMLMTKSGFIREPMYYWMNQANSITRTQDHFAVKYAYDVVSTLRLGYENIFAHGGNNTRTWNNMGNHIALFHTLLNDLIDLGDDYAENKAKMMEELKKFMSVLNVNKSNPHSIDVIKGFCNGFCKYPKEKFYVGVNEFFRLVESDIRIEPEHYNRLGEKKPLSKEEMLALGATIE